MAKNILLEPISPINPPHNFFIHKALETINEEFGPVYADLSEEVGNILYDACVAAAGAALVAAGVSDDWRDYHKSYKREWRRKSDVPASE